MLTVLGAEGTGGGEAHQGDVKPPSWAPDLGRKGFVMRFSSISKLCLQPGTWGSGSPWVFTARSPVHSPVQRDEVGGRGRTSFAKAYGPRMTLPEQGLSGQARKCTLLEKASAASESW